MTEWISVQDRLPKEDQEVLVWAEAIEDSEAYKKGEKYFALDCFVKIHGLSKPNFRTYIFYPAKVTHWMPLPEPPK